MRTQRECERDRERERGGGGESERERHREREREGERERERNRERQIVITHVGVFGICFIPFVLFCVQHSTHEMFPHKISINTPHSRQE